MERAPDRYRYIFERSLRYPAGARWIYCGGATALLAHMIAAGTGKRLSEFADEVLFGPLGISHYEWAAGADGTPSAASGLRMSAHGLASIGSLVASEGQWRGQKIVAKAWLEDSFANIVPTGDGLHYGWHWFIGRENVPAVQGPRRTVGAFGNGGQRLWIMPDVGVVMVAFSGAYNRNDAAVSPTRIWREIILTNLLK